MTKERFKEVVSTQKILDTKSGKEYNGLIDDELLKVMNNIEYYRKFHRKEKEEFREVIHEMGAVINGFIALEKLRNEGWI